MPGQKTADTPLHPSPCRRAWLAAITAAITAATAAAITAITTATTATTTATTTAALLISGLLHAPLAQAQGKVLLRISTPAVSDAWHGKMWTVFKHSQDKSAPGQFEVQINLNAARFKQGTEPAAMARGNLELSSISAFDIARQVPEFPIFTAGHVIRDPQHPQKVFAGPIGREMFKLATDKMDLTLLTPRCAGRHRHAAGVW